jgi:hypothetical protein
MNILTQIALLTGLIACISLIWLVGRAFSKHAAWGLAVLLLSPLTAVMFGIRYWREEKGPFLVYVVTFSIAMTLGLYVFSVKVGWDVVRNTLHTPPPAAHQATGGNGGMAFVQTSLSTVRESSVHARDDTEVVSQHPDTADPAHPDSAATTNAGGQAAPDKNTPKVTSAKLIEPNKRYRAAYVPITPAKAGNYVGMTVKVKRLNRPEQDCVLRRVTPTTLAFEQHGRGGTFSFEYRYGDIEKLKVLVKQPY